ncbi:MAG: tyrosine-type recombinase/integrase [Brevundimonas sp.]
MPVYKRGDIWWYDFTVNGERYRGSTGARLKEDAAKIENREFRKALMGGLHQDITLEAAADLWFAAKVAGRKSAKTTAHRVEIMLRHLGPRTKLTDIGPLKVTQAVNSRRVEAIRRGKNRKAINKLPSAATVNRDIIDTTLRPIIRYARKNLEVEMREIDWSELRLEEPREVVRWFTEEELKARSDQLPHWHQPIQRFIQRYGVRLREAFFPLSAVHDDGKTMDIYTAVRKNGPHVVTLLEEDAAEMRARIGRAVAAELDTVWFREMKDGSLTAIHWRAYQSAASAANRRSGVQARAVHDDRHHAGTTLLRKTGGNLAAVKKLLGHEVISSTMRYAHTSRDDLRDALRHAYGTIENVTPEKPKKAEG